MKRVRTFLKLRARGIGLVALIAVVAHFAIPSPPPRTLDGLAEMLGQATDGTVLPEDIAWEPSPGFLTEAFYGRRILFLSKPDDIGARDLFRARVRVTLDGKPIDVRGLRNITDTPLGDDAALEIKDGRAVYATVAYDRIQAVSLLEVGGVPKRDIRGNLFQRFLAGITSFQRTGSFRGLGRTDIVLDTPVRRARLTVAGPATKPTLTIDVGRPSRNLVYEIDSRKIASGTGGPAYAARVVPAIQHPKPLIHWGVDTVRSQVGPAPIAWLENKVFGARDLVRRNAYGLLNTDELRDDPNAAVVDASKLEEQSKSWPPPSIPSLWKETKPGEGEWEPVKLPWDDAAGGRGDQDPYFYQSFIRPDPKRPYSEVWLLAMDMRQLEIGMEAGLEDPKPLTGPPGSGRLPKDPDILNRVVATFNGAFKTTHGKYGMMVRRRVLVPPVKGGATVIVTDDGEVGLGNWPQTEDIPEHIVSYRQNLDPLVEDGTANPTGRYIWGWQLAGTSMMTERTGMCVNPAGHLYFAWGREIDGPTLGRALRQAGCTYGIHLDMNPKHCGFVFTDIVDVDSGEFQLKLGHEDMTIAPDRYVRYSPKDFFYVMRRDHSPRDKSKVAWKPAEATQPPPAWAPAVYEGEKKIGNLKIALTSFEPGRIEWRLRAGQAEPQVVDARPMKRGLGEEDRHRVVGAVGLAHTTPATKYGISFGTEASFPLRSSYATVVLRGNRPPQIFAPGETVKLRRGLEVVQLPLLAKGGRLEGAVGDAGAMRLRGAMCTMTSGRVVVATATHDSYDPIAQALLKVGCDRIVATDRGSRHNAFIHLAGTDTPPIGTYETTVLYALGRPMPPRAFHWKAKGATKASKPTSADYKLSKGQMWFPDEE